MAERQASLEPPVEVLRWAGGPPMFRAIAGRQPWIDRISDRFFERSFQEAFRRSVEAFRARERLGARAFGSAAVGDSYCYPGSQFTEPRPYHHTNEERGLTLRRYWSNGCQACAIKSRCTTGKERRVTRWDHGHLLEQVQARLDAHPEKMRARRETVEHPFGTIKMWMGSSHFLMKTLKKVRTEMALHVLAYNLKRVMNIMGVGPLMATIRA